MFTKKGLPRATKCRGIQLLMDASYRNRRDSSNRVYNYPRAGTKSRLLTSRGTPKTRKSSETWPCVNLIPRHEWFGQPDDQYPATPTIKG